MKAASTQRPSRATIAASRAGDLVTVAEAADRAGIAAITVYSWLYKGYLQKRGARPRRPSWRAAPGRGQAALVALSEVGAWHGRRWLTINAAAAVCGLPENRIRYWLESGRLRRRGTGRGHALLLSLDDLRAEVARRADELARKGASLSLVEAAERLEMSPEGVALMCKRGELSYRRHGRQYEIDRASLEELCVERGRLVPITEGARLTGLPRSVIEGLIKAGRLDETRRGQRRLVDRDVLVAASAELEAKREPCECGCGELAPAGRRFIRGHNAAMVIQRYWADPDARRQASARSQAWSSSAAGRAHAERLAAAYHKPRIAVPCAVCARPVELLEAQVAKKQRNHERAICQSCCPGWRRALASARLHFFSSDPSCAIGAREHEAFERAVEAGRKFEHETRLTWPRQRGRRPPIALNIAVEAAFQAGFSDRRIRLLINSRLASGRLRIPGVGGAPVNGRYVTRRRQEAGIRRHSRSAAS